MQNAGEGCVDARPAAANWDTDLKHADRSVQPCGLSLAARCALVPSVFHRVQGRGYGFNTLPPICGQPC